MRGWVFNILKVLVSASLLAYILMTQVNVDQLATILFSSRGSYLVAAAILMIMGTGLRAVRWQALLRPLNIQVPLRLLVYWFFVGAFFNLFLPTGMGGDAVKMAKLGQYTGRHPEAIGTTLVDRATGLWVLFVLALLALPFSYHLLPPKWIVSTAAIAAGGVVGGLLVMATPLLPWLGSRFHLPGQAKLDRFYGSVSKLGFRALGEACLISLAFDLLLILYNVWIAASLKVDQPLGIFLLFTPLISFSLALPISIGGLGVREQTYLTLFAVVGIPGPIAVAMSLLNYLLTNVVVGAIGGGLYALEGVRALARRNG
jgi:uncharacterized membrane protein YbhN (UPF0104 family)